MGITKTYKLQLVISILLHQMLLAINLQLVITIPLSIPLIYLHVNTLNDRMVCPETIYILPAHVHLSSSKSRTSSEEVCLIFSNKSVFLGICWNNRQCPPGTCCRLQHCSLDCTPPTPPPVTLKCHTDQECRRDGRGECCRTWNWKVCNYWQSCQCKIGAACHPTPPPPGKKIITSYCR